jgi:hypothetical protein
MSRSFVNALTFPPQSITSNNRKVIVTRDYDVTCLPGLHIAVSIVDPELASFGHFSHYLDSPYSISAGMTSSSSWRDTHSTTTGVLTHPQSTAAPAPGTPPVPLTTLAFHILHPPNPLQPRRQNTGAETPTRVRRMNLTARDISCSPRELCSISWCGKGDKGRSFRRTLDYAWELTYPTEILLRLASSPKRRKKDLHREVQIIIILLLLLLLFL